MAQGAEILTRWATVLAAEDASAAMTSEIAAWSTIAQEFTIKTRLMWQNGWFRDYDSMAREWSSQQDAMHLAPIFCGASSWEHVEQLREFLKQPPMHSSGWAPLSWPPVVMTLVGAAAAARMPLDAAELAYRFIDASYRSTDSREVDEHGGLPGVTREYRRTITAGKWGAIDYANAGIEGYGWGALSIHLLIRYLIGLYENEPGTLSVRPSLPQVLRRSGATYRLESVQWGPYVLNVMCTVRNIAGYTMRVSCLAGDGYALEQEQHWEWAGTWGGERILTLPQLTKSSVNQIQPLEST